MPPNADTTLVGTDTNQILSNKTIDETCTLSNPTLNTYDSTLIIQNTATPTKRIKFECSSITAGQTRTLTVPDADLTIVGTETAQILTNKTLTTPVISTISNTGTVTLPTATTTLVGRDTTDTLTNKTLTSPIISTISNTGTLTLPTATTTLVGRDTTDTLTNKTIADATSTITWSSTSASDSGWTTPIASKTFSFQAHKMGQIVMLDFNVTLTGTTNASAIVSKTAIIPSGYRPQIQYEYPVRVRNTNFTTGLLIINSSGDVSFYADMTGSAWPSGGVNFQIGRFSVCYPNV
jgi:hypothetical protein